MLFNFNKYGRRCAEVVVSDSDLRCAIAGEGQGSIKPFCTIAGIDSSYGAFISNRRYIYLNIGRADGALTACSKEVANRNYVIFFNLNILCCSELFFRLNSTIFFKCEFHIFNTVFFEVFKTEKCSYAHIKTGHKLVEGNEVALTVFLKVVKLAVAVKVKVLVDVGVGLIRYVMQVSVEIAA